MGVNSDLVGSVFTSSEASLGSVTGTNPITYTEEFSGEVLGASAIATIDSVATTDGVTTVTATISGSPVFDGTLSGTLIGNDTSDFLVNGNFPVIGNTNVFFTNTAALQPGVNNTATIAGESANVTYVPVCYASGTRIRTATGDVAVEALKVGDVVQTASGALRPIRWLGSRTFDCRRHPRPHETMPIRIAAHAFGDNRPSRDLVVSPGHSICVDVAGEVLIPASSLLNGTTIVQLEIDRVTYWHLELDTHDIVLAENLPAESYLEMGNRSFFAENGIVALAAAPDIAAPTHADFCRPFSAAGTLVEAVRARLAARAAKLQGKRRDVSAAA